MTREIVICATQRSGSTLLCEDIRATGHLGLPNEHFLPCLNKLEAADWHERLAADRTKFSTPNGVYAVKVMMSYLGDIDARLAEAAGKTRASDTRQPFPEFRALFADARFVWLRRINHTEQAISREMARQTGVTHAVQDPNAPSFMRRNVVAYDDDYNAAAKVDVDSIIGEINAIAAENEKWLYFFKQWDIEPLMIEYETILDDPYAHIRRIAEFAGVDLPDWTHERRLAKLANARSEDLYHRVLEKMLRD